MLVTIVDRGLGEKVVGFNQAHDVKVNMTCLGRGTASSRILDLLGVGSTEKDVVLSFVPVSRGSRRSKTSARKWSCKNPARASPSRSRSTASPARTCSTTLPPHLEEE